MNDVTFTMDQIRAVAIEELADYVFLKGADYASFTHGVIALTAKLSDLAGENVKDSCLDKNGEAGE